MGGFNDEQLHVEADIKKRLIELNNIEYRRKNNTIVGIISAFVSFFISFVGLLLYLSNIITTQTFVSIFIVSCILFALLSYNIYKNVWKKLYKSMSDLEYEILSEGEKRELQAKQWIDDKCECKQNQ